MLIKWESVRSFCSPVQIYIFSNPQSLWSQLGMAKKRIFWGETRKLYLFAYPIKTRVFLKLGVFSTKLEKMESLQDLIKRFQKCKQWFDSLHGMTVWGRRWGSWLGPSDPLYPLPPSWFNRLTQPLGGGVGPDPSSPPPPPHKQATFRGGCLTSKHLVWYSVNRRSERSETIEQMPFRRMLWFFEN